LNSRHLIGALLISTLLGCVGRPTAVVDVVVPVGDRKLSFPVDQWRAMPNEYAFVRNFEAIANNLPRQYQIVTVFLNQMSEDRRSGRLIAANEYLELFMSNPNEITVMVRRDHGTYWLLSREMFRGVAVSGVDQGLMGSLSMAESEQVADSLRAEIDNTRFLLGERLRPR